MKLDREALVPNPTIEFSEATSTPVPDLREFRISVIYTLLENEHPGLLDVSLSSLAKYFPTALEVVIVEHARGPSLASLVEKHANDASSPFPVRLISENLMSDEGMGMAGALRARSLQRLTADDYCEGDYVLHLNPTSILFRHLTYKDIFHFGKPVLPYQRHPEGECEFLSCRS